MYVNDSKREEKYRIKKKKEARKKPVARSFHTDALYMNRKNHGTFSK